MDGTYVTRTSSECKWRREEDEGPSSNMEMLSPKGEEESAKETLGHNWNSSQLMEEET